MPSNRLTNIPGFSIDRVAAAAGNDPDILRMENLDTDLPPPPAAIEATKTALSNDNANSYLPFTGSMDLRTVVGQHLHRQTGVEYAPDQIVTVFRVVILSSTICLRLTQADMKTDHKIWRFDSDQDRLAGSPASQRTPAVGSFRPELAESRAKAANLSSFAF